ncbi:hypothetical protein M408DRAFT_7942 [Serendipita vermifera MAFF 305830]|uniref:Uncharacterized protein n=1 Tax=Serendipita vermifera MAFF 305830 TaxID=933852 RepID=A0A0C3BD77_SERVB|nr:hypothetical protein M408DRAFT_7942 [Serendipita vermifera MAFF 305830]
MPSLSTLTVDIGMTDSIVSLTQCNPLRTKELRSITLIWGRGRVKYLRPPLLLESLPRLLSRFPDIDTIYMKGRVLDILLKALWVVPEESRPAVIGGKRLVNIDRDCFFDFVGTEDNASLELLAAEWELLQADDQYLSTRSSWNRKGGKKPKNQSKYDVK